MEQPLLVAVSAIIKNNKILLLKRSKPPYEDLWSLPGGKVKFGEHIEEAAMREVKEETDLDTDFVGVKGIVSERLEEEEGGIEGHFIIFVCELEPRTDKFKISEEGNLKWFDLNLKKLKNIVIPSDYKMLSDFVLKKNKIDISRAVMKKVRYGYVLDGFK